MNIRDFEYGYPDGAYLLFAVFAIALLLWLLHLYRERVLRAFLPTSSNHQLAVKRSRLYEGLRVGALCVAWMMAVVALMQPRGNARYLGAEQPEAEPEVIAERLLEEGETGKEMSEVTLQRKAHDVIFLVDASASMSVKDTRTEVTRLEHAKELIEEVMSRLEGQNTALYAFTSEVSPVVPATTDYLYLRLQLKRVGINEGDVAGTDLLAALGGIRQRHLAESSQKLKTLILLTDGGDTRLENTPPEEREKELNAILSRLESSEELNFRLFSIGLGSKQGEIIPNITFEEKPVHSSLDEDLLQKLAEKGRGRYYLANEYSVLSIAADIIKLMGQDSPFIEEEVHEEQIGKVERTLEQEEERELAYDLFFQIPLGIALLAIVMALCLPEVRR